MNVVIDKDRLIVHGVFYVRYAAQKVMMYILQFNESTKHKFRRLYCYISTHEVTVYDTFLCRHTLQMYLLMSLSELLNAIRNLTL